MIVQDKTRLIGQLPQFLSPAALQQGFFVLYISNSGKTFLYFFLFQAEWASKLIIFGNYFFSLTPLVAWNIKSLAPSI